MIKGIIVSFCIGLLVLTGCTGQVISKTIRETSWPIKGFAEVRANPEKFIDKTIIVGGMIIDAINNEDGSSTLFVLSFPLDHSGEPQKWENNQGRFIVNTSQFLDPQIYKRDRELTVAGTVSGVETSLVGKTQYRYVTLNALQLYLWPSRYHLFSFPIYPESYSGQYSDDIHLFDRAR